MPERTGCQRERNLTVRSLDRAVALEEVLVGVGRMKLHGGHVVCVFLPCEITGYPAGEEGLAGTGRAVENDLVP